MTEHGKLLTVSKMIILPEQYGFKASHKENLIDFSLWRDAPENGLRSFAKKKGDGLCYKFWKVNDQNKYQFETSYYVGVDWLIEGEKPIYIEPKQNDEEIQINYLKILVDAFSTSLNTNDLDELFEVDFSKEFIEIEQSQDLLTPLLVIQYLQLLKKITKKGLRKSYYKTEQNLNSRVKGKVCINHTIKQNIVRSKNTHTVCNFEEFGINSIENRVLKKAFIFCKAILSNTQIHSVGDNKELCNFIEPTLHSVTDDVNILELRHIKPNPLFPEYENALKLAKIILRKYGYSISILSERKIHTPPFWIDMSKLFELYVLSKLREQFPLKGEVIYHPNVNGYEPDFLLKTNDGLIKAVIDAKYKPRYENNQISIDDIRQVAGYARMEGIYKILEIKDLNKSIDCVIIFSSQLAQHELSGLDLSSDTKINNFSNIFKIGVRLPIVD